MKKSAERQHARRIVCSGHSCVARVQTHAGLLQVAHRPVCARAYATDVQHLSGEQQQPLIQEVEWSAQDANFVSIIGNLGSDPDLRKLSGGHIKVSLNLAVKNFKKETSWCGTLHPQCHGFQCNPSMNAEIVSSSDG